MQKDQFLKFKSSLLELEKDSIELKDRHLEFIWRKETKQFKNTTAPEENVIDSIRNLFILKKEKKRN